MYVLLTPVLEYDMEFDPLQHALPDLAPEVRLYPQTYYLQLLSRKDSDPPREVDIADRFWLLENHNIPDHSYAQVAGLLSPSATMKARTQLDNWNDLAAQGGPFVSHSTQQPPVFDDDVY